MLYGILVQHFASLAGGRPLPLAHLDALTRHILDLTPEVPFYAATVARARLTRLQQRLGTALTDPVRLAALVNKAHSPMLASYYALHSWGCCARDGFLLVGLQGAAFPWQADACKAQRPACSRAACFSRVMHICCRAPANPDAPTRPGSTAA